MADFRLEQDDDGQDTHIQEGIHQDSHHAHVQGAHHGLDHQHDDQHQHNIEYGGVPFDATDEQKDDNGHHGDVQDIGPAKTEKTPYAGSLQ